MHTAEGVAEVYSRIAAAQAARDEKRKSSEALVGQTKHLDYLWRCRTEDFDRQNDELARMCSERFGRDVNTNMITGRLLRTRCGKPVLSRAMGPATSR